MGAVHGGVQVAKLASSVVYDRVGNMARDSEIHARNGYEESKSSQSHANGLRQRVLRR